MTRLFVALCALTLAGCGSTAKTSAPPIDPRAEYQNSLDAYQACVNSNQARSDGNERADLPNPVIGTP